MSFACRRNKLTILDHCLLFYVFPIDLTTFRSLPTQLRTASTASPYFLYSLRTSNNAICHFASSSHHKNSAVIAHFIDGFNRSSLAASLIRTVLQRPVVLHVTPSIRPPPTITYVDQHLPLLVFVFPFAESPVSVSQLLRLFVDLFCAFTVGPHGDDMVRFSTCTARLDSLVLAPLPAFIFCDVLSCPAFTFCCGIRSADLAFSELQMSFSVCSFLRLTRPDVTAIPWHCSSQGSPIPSPSTYSRTFFITYSRANNIPSTTNLSFFK
jgi:hypothetical protein